MTPNRQGRDIFDSMIPHEDLVNALADWRARQGLPPLHNYDYLGEFKQERIDTSSAILAVTGSLAVGDLDHAGASYDDPLADPPVAAGGDDPWAVSDYESAEELDDPFASSGEYASENYAGGDYGDDAVGFTVDEELPIEDGIANHAGVQPQAAHGYEYDDVEAPTSYDVGDSTAMFQELAPSQSGQHDDPSGYPQGDYDPSVGQATAMYDTSLAANAAANIIDDSPVAPGQFPNVGESTAIFDTSLASNAAAAVNSEQLPPPPPPSAGTATAMYDTSLASNAAAAAGYGEYDGGVPSEPVYDSMAAQAEYQAERLAEQQSQHDPGYGAHDSNQGYADPGQADPGGYNYAQDYDQNEYNQMPPTGEAAPLEPASGNDYAFQFSDDDDEFGKV